MVPVERKDLLTLRSTTPRSTSFGSSFSSHRSIRCFRAWFAWFLSYVCTRETGSRGLDQPNYKRIGGWSTSSFRTTRHPVAKVLDRKMLDPSQARFWIRKLRQTWYNQQILYTYSPASRWGTFLCNIDPGATFRFLMLSESAFAEVGGIQYQNL